MSIETAKRYFQVSDDPASEPADIAALFSEDAVLQSPREGTFRGREAIEEFYELNAAFFASGSHRMTSFYEDGDTVICEGTIAGETTAGRTYEGVGLVDVMEFDGDRIAALRVYLDYSGILSELPETVPSFE